MIELPRPDCLRRLAATAFGRIVVSVAGWDHPVIRPVNYLFDESSQCVLLRSALGSKLHPSYVQRGRRLRSMAQMPRGGSGGA
ncbi:MAG: pyridoxamine 5'-phosphate oxidase family protein [Solirubrobacteraceae bacterium]